MYCAPECPIREAQKAVVDSCPNTSACPIQEQKRQEVLSLDNYVAYNDALIDERDQGIAEIGQQINEVHEIFQVALLGLSAMLRRT